MKLKHMSDWFCVTSGQLWSFKFEDAHNWLHACSDHHSPLKDESHDRSIQDMKDFLIEGSPVIHQRNFNAYNTKIEAIWRSFHIGHITNHATSVKKEATHKDKATIISKTVDQVDLNQGGSIGDFQSTSSPIRNQNSPGLMTYSGASDDTSIFTRTRGTLNIKHQTDRSTHKEVGPNK
jgi:hypothetical protein